MRTTIPTTFIPSELKPYLNTLAARFYAMQGYRVADGFDFSQATHPSEKLCYQMAIASLQELDQWMLENTGNSLDDIANGF